MRIGLSLSSPIQSCKACVDFRLPQREAAPSSSVVTKRKRINTLFAIGQTTLLLQGERSTVKAHADAEYQTTSTRDQHRQRLVFFRRAFIDHCIDRDLGSRYNHLLSADVGEIEQEALSTERHSPLGPNPQVHVYCLTTDDVYLST